MKVDCLENIPIGTLTEDNYCWVCKELVKVGKVDIRFYHITKELDNGEFKYCPRCGRSIDNV